MKKKLKIELERNVTTSRFDQRICAMPSKFKLAIVPLTDLVFNDPQSIQLSHCLPSHSNNHAIEIDRYGFLHIYDFIFVNLWENEYESFLEIIDGRKRIKLLQYMNVQFARIVWGALKEEDVRFLRFFLNYQNLEAAAAVSLFYEHSIGFEWKWPPVDGRIIEYPDWARKIKGL